MRLPQDLRYALRMLRRSPGFTIVVTLTLALGIGANSAIFSLVNAFLLRPLPYPHAEQLVRVYSEFPTFPNGGLHRFWISAPEYLELRDTTRSWQSLDAWTTGGVNLSGATQPLRVNAAFVTGGLLASLGVAPARGRAITPTDDQPGAPQVVDLSWALWQRAFGGDPGVIGHDTLFNGAQTTIVGVMPPGFDFPLNETEPVEAWSPLQINPAKPGGWATHYLYLLGRLKPGISPTAAQAEFQSLETAWAPAGHSGHQHNFSPDFHPLTSYPLQSEVTGGVRPALLMLLGAVGLVLLIACVNVASLLLARAEVRQKEIAIREALGARTSRLLRQFITEGVLLSLLGATAGLLLAEGALRAIQTASDGSIPRLAEAGLDARALWFTLALSLLTGVAFGLAPLAHVSGRRISTLLKTASGSSTARPGAQRFRQALVVAEIGLALVLLIGAGLLLRTFWDLQRVDLGFQPDHLMTMQVALPLSAGNAEKDALMQRLEAGTENLPGVESAALVSGLPPNRPPNDNDTDIEGFVRQVGGPIQNVEYYQAVSPGYFHTMGIKLLAGRSFDQRDGPGGTDVAIVNQRMASTFWPGQNPIGRRIRPGGTDPWVTVVGVVADVKNKGVDQAAGTEVYLPLGQKQASGTGSIYIVARGETGAASQVSAIRNLMRRLDPSLPLAHVASMDTVLDGAEAKPRFLALLLAIFSAVALSLAAVGIYGVVSYTVVQRRREFGLRAALGAQPADLLRLVLVQGLRLALIGAAGGGLAGVLLLRTLRGLLFGVQPTDPGTFLSMTLLLIAVAMIACWIPALRATRIDPMTALREE